MATLLSGTMLGILDFYYQTRAKGEKNKLICLLKTRIRYVMEVNIDFDLDEQGQQQTMKR